MKGFRCGTCRCDVCVPSCLRRHEAWAMCAAAFRVRSCVCCHLIGSCYILTALNRYQRTVVVEICQGTRCSLKPQEHLLSRFGTTASACAAAKEAERQGLLQFTVGMQWACSASIAGCTAQLHGFCDELQLTLGFFLQYTKSFPRLRAV